MRLGREWEMSEFHLTHYCLPLFSQFNNKHYLHIHNKAAKHTTESFFFMYVLEFYQFSRIVALIGS